MPSSIHTYAIASVVSFLMLATVLSAPAPVRIKVSPQTLFAGQAINLTCYIPPPASNRQLRYGIENYTESRRDLQGDTDYPTHGPYLIQHIPCDATTAYCSVLRNDGTQVMVTARLLLAGCN